MDEPVVVPGPRDVHGTLSGPADANAVVVACPPHPLHGGSRNDPRLVAVCDELAARGVACLRFDYGEWADGVGELGDVERAIAWAVERFERVGVFGYSFGGCLAVLAARDADALSVLAPVPELGDDLDAVAAVESIACPMQVVYGDRDTTVDSRVLADRVGASGGDEVTYSADHFFVGQHDDVAAVVASFLADAL